MRVLFLQDHVWRGGAARAAARFAQALRVLGIEVSVVAGDEKPGEGYWLNGKPAWGLDRILKTFQTAEGSRTYRIQNVEDKWARILEEFRPDLIWVHNLQGAIKWGWSLKLVEMAFRSAPVLWTLHDMWPLGDGPSYFPENELPQRWRGSALRSLRQAMSSGKGTLLAPSDWLRNLIDSVGAGPCRTWANPLDVEAFHPRTRTAARAKLGIPEKSLLLLATAENLEDPRKGIDLLAEVWTRFRDTPSLYLALMGRNFPMRLKKDPKVFELGSVATEAQVAQWMSAADLFVHPAEVESYGLVLEEAQACGTPILAFGGGGVRETLREGVTGWILPNRSAKELTKGLQRFLSQEKGVDGMRKQCRDFMVKKHDPSNFGKKWEEIVALLGLSRPA